MQQKLNKLYAFRNEWVWDFVIEGVSYLVTGTRKVAHFVMNGPIGI